MADLVEIDYRLLTVIARCGLPLGFGEKTVVNMCAEADVDARAFILICNMYSCFGYVPADESLKEADPLTILKYLQRSHLSYMDDGFSSMELSINELVAPCPAAQRKVILDFFEDYRTEVRSHFEYEETVFFPYVESVVSGGSTGDYSASIFEENHSNIEEKLKDLTNIVMKYLPAACSNILANKLLYSLFALSEDLGKHTEIENLILVPMVNRLEALKKSER